MISTIRKRIRVGDTAVLRPWGPMQSDQGDPSPLTLGSNSSEARILNCGSEIFLEINLYAAFF
jgi:hypothetical protein